MYFITLFAAAKLNVDPDTMNALNWTVVIFYAAGVLAIIGLLAWKILPVVHAELRQRRLDKIGAANAIWFEHKESVLHCGHNTIRIEPKSLEHFVCRITFRVPSKYYDDLDIFEGADRAKATRETRRGVEQAVRRLNKKAKKLGLKNDLLKRGKDSTSVNDEYREHIVKN